MIINSAKVEDHCLRTVVLPIEHASEYYLECWLKHRPLPPTPRVSDFIYLVWVCVSRWWSQGTLISSFGMDLLFLLATGVFSCIFTVEYPAESSEQILGISPSFLSVQPSPSLCPPTSVSPDSRLCLNSESPLGSACTPSLCCRLESICRQFAGEIPGLPLSVVSSPRDHSFIAWCSMSSKPLFYLLFTSSKRVNPFCFSIWGRNRVPIYVFFKKNFIFIGG